MSDIHDRIERYNQKLERRVLKLRRKEQKILHYIRKLDQLPVTVAHLEQTGVGRTINELKQYGNNVTEASNDLVAKWKEMVVQEGLSEQETSEDEIAKPHDSPKNEPASPAPPVIENMLHDVGNNEYQNGDELDFDETDDCSEDDDETDSGNETSMVEDMVEDVVLEPYQEIRENASNEGSAFDSHEEPSRSRKRKSEYSDAGSDPDGKRLKGSDSSRSDKQDESSSKHSSSHSTDDHKSKSKDERERGESSKGSHHSHKNKDHSRSSNKMRCCSSEDECHEDSKQTIDKIHSSLHSKGTPSKHTKYESSDDQEKHSEEESPSRHHQSSSSRHSKDKSTNAKHKKHDNTELKHSSTERKHSSKDEKHESEKSDAQIGFKDSSSSRNDKHRPKSNKDPSDRDNKHKSKHEKHASSDSKRDSKQQKHSLKSENSSSNDHKKDLKHELELKEHMGNSKDRKHSSKSDRRTSKDDKSEKHNSISLKGEKQPSSDSKNKDSERKNNSIESSSSDRKIKTKEKSKSSKLTTQKRELIDPIDSCSGASFAEALRMCTPVIGKTNKKKTPIGDTSLIHADKASSSSEKLPPNLSMQNNDRDSDLPSLLKEPSQSMDPPDVNITNLLPPNTPSYRHLGITTLDISQKKLTEDEATSKAITTKNQRTKVYSGNKTVRTKVPTLFDLCTRVLQYNLDALKYTAGVPYDTLKPILEKATCHQLYMLEHRNPYIIDDSDELWKLHCMKDFRTNKREEWESWRDMYLRCKDEREAKLRALTANIKQSQAKSLPVRTIKLAYVDDYVKPPRNVLRQQAAHGTAHEKRPTIRPAVRAATASTTKGSAAEAKVVVQNPEPRAAGRSSHAQLKVKPKKAPLMAKALSDLKNRFRR